LKVNAQDKATGREQAMQILPSSGLSDEEIDGMVSEAEKYASEDAERKASVEASNLADSSVYSAEKFVEENSDKLSEAQKSSIQAEIESVKSAAESSPEGLKSAVDRLQQALQEVGTAMYQQQQQAEEPTPEAPAEESPDEDVVADSTVSGAAPLVCTLCVSRQICSYA
jgi:molecular chaperone DnaK